MYSRLPLRSSRSAPAGGADARKDIESGIRLSPPLLKATMSYQAVLFDLDGTLLDTLEDLADSTNAALAELGLPGHKLDAYRYFVGDGVENLVRRAMGGEAADESRLASGIELTRQQYANHWADKSRPYPGIADLLNGLSRRGIAMAVFSNKPHEFTQLCVTRLLPDWRFAAVQGATPELPRKPDPQGALAIAARLGIAPADFLYLGDTNTDMQTAVAAGMFPVGAVWGFRTADELLASGAAALARMPIDVLQLVNGRE
jgi:phosphoglycolate phosphatase